MKGFSCDLEDIIQRGEQGFNAAYKAFVDEVDGVLVRGSLTWALVLMTKC